MSSKKSSRFPEKFTDIFSAVGIRKQIAETIHNILSIAYEDIDGQPTKVCRSCQGKLDGFAKFKTKAMEINNTVIRQVTSKRCLLFSKYQSDLCL